MLIAPEEPGTDTVSVPVLKVFDGDGFLTRIWNPRSNATTDVAVRFGFIDAPELEQPGGKEAHAFLSSLISNRWLELAILMKMDTGGIVDRHGRIVCIPYLRQEQTVEPLTGSPITRLVRSLWGTRSLTRNIELEMVLNGWAWVLERYEPDERYFDALADARRHKRGIWVSDSNIHPREFKRQKYRTRQPARGSRLQPSLFVRQDSQPECPHAGCGGHLVRRNGKFGRFLGCSNFPTCRYSCSDRD